MTESGICGYPAPALGKDSRDSVIAQGLHADRRPVPAQGKRVHAPNSTFGRTIGPKYDESWTRSYNHQLAS